MNRDWIEIILINDPFVSLVVEPHLVYSFLDYRVVVYSFSLPVLVRKDLETELKKFLTNNKSYYLIYEAFILLQGLRNLPILSNRAFAASTVKAVKRLHQGSCLRFSLTSKLGPSSLNLDKSPSKIA